MTTAFLIIENCSFKKLLAVKLNFICENSLSLAFFFDCFKKITKHVAQKTTIYQICKSTEKDELLLKIGITQNSASNIIVLCNTHFKMKVKHSNY